MPTGMSARLEAHGADAVDGARRRVACWAHS